MNINTQRIKTDVLVIGGGTAGKMAGVKVKQANHNADVLILEKANIRCGGAIALGNLAHPDVICVGVASRRHRHRKKLILERI
ncbi:MAG: FAD-binding protein [Nostoc sp. ChiQUE02]|uniref:FAD-binding protein n=1 Tax=Nostoc sp. ChiQUE02 TaxID=3075377 RepID=UPI002AD49FA1|nr:FAD-binding protein [Nostoc sp. ChiQUE02]MDZ8229809.1 FAD-binding protein [Nostoc sp. ChiQUE02]